MARRQRTRASKRSPRCLGRRDRDRGVAIATPEQLREPKQSCRAQTAHAWMWAKARAKRICSTPALRQATGSCRMCRYTTTGRPPCGLADCRFVSRSDRLRTRNPGAAGCRPTHQSGRGPRACPRSWASRSAATSTSSSLRTELATTSRCICTFELAAGTCRHSSAPASPGRGRLGYAAGRAASADRPEHQRRGRRGRWLLRHGSDSQVRLQVAADRLESKHNGTPVRVAKRGCGLAGDGGDGRRHGRVSQLANLGSRTRVRPAPALSTTRNSRQRCQKRRRSRPSTSPR
jgi:hypothetical protein